MCCALPPALLACGGVRLPVLKWYWVEVACVGSVCGLLCWEDGKRRGAECPPIFSLLPEMPPWGAGEGGSALATLGSHCLPARPL